MIEFFTTFMVASFVPEIENQQLGSKEYLVVGVASGINGILSLFGTPLIGRLSDAMGRKWLMLMTVIATAFPACSLLVVVPLMPEHGMLVYEGLRAASGILAATLSLSFAVAADVTTEEQRASAIGAVVSVFGVGLAIAPITGELLSQAFGTVAPRVLAVVLTALNSLYVVFVLPETVPPRPHAPRLWDHVRSPLETIGPMLSHRVLRLVGGVVFFVNVTEQGLISLLISFLQRHLGFTPMNIGVFALALGLLMALSQAFLLPALLKRFETRTVILLATLTNAVQTALYGVVDEKWQVFLALLLAVMAFLGFGAATDLVSAIVPRTRQGQFQGAVTGIRALTNGIGPTIFGPLLTATCTTASHNGHPPPFSIGCGTTFFVGSALVLVAAVLACFLPGGSEAPAIREEVRAAARTAEGRGRGHQEGQEGDDGLAPGRRVSRLSLGSERSADVSFGTGALDPLLAEDFEPAALQPKVGVGIASTNRRRA